MNHFIVSDFHACDKGPRDRFNFGDRPERFAHFLDFVSDHCGRLIVAGDLLDLWQCNFSRAAKANMPLLDKLAALGATYVVGNHDVDLLHFVGKHFLNHPIFDNLTTPFVLNDGKIRVKICHGHEADEYCASEQPGIGRMTAIITGLLEDKNGGPMKGKFSVEELSVGVLEKLVGWHERIWHRPQRDLALIDGLHTFIDKGECDYVVGGHTHTPGRKGDWYFNSGCWCLRTDSFVWINEDGVSVWDWDGRRPVPNNIILG